MLTDLNCVRNPACISQMESPVTFFFLKIKELIIKSYICGTIKI